MGERELTEEFVLQRGEKNGGIGRSEEENQKGKCVFKVRYSE